MLKVAPGSVTNTIENLEKRNLVVHKPYKGVKLTDKGRQIALNILRKHRIAERLLTDFLKIPWCDVHEYACALEHVIDDKLTSAIEKTLGHPTVCPHGNEIPSRDGVIKQDRDVIPLTQLDVGKESIIVKITDEKREKLRLLASIGLKLNVKINVLQRTGKNTKIIISTDGENRKLHTLANDVATTIWVKPVKR